MNNGFLPLLRGNQFGDPEPLLQEWIGRKRHWSPELPLPGTLPGDLLAAHPACRLASQVVLRVGCRRGSPISFGIAQKDPAMIA